jgi:hypothetical protein
VARNVAKVQRWPSLGLPEMAFEIADGPIAHRIAVDKIVNEKPIFNGWYDSDAGTANPIVGNHILRLSE